MKAKSRCSRKKGGGDVRKSKISATKRGGFAKKFGGKNKKYREETKKGGEMKKVLLVLVILGFLVLTVGSVFAAWFEKEKAPQGQAAPQQKTVRQTTVTQKQTVPLEEIIAKKKAELNGTEWTVEMRPMGTKGKAETDVISFAEDKVVSKNLSTLGFGPTNFSVRLENDGTVIWETMQSSEKDGMAFWRGDIKDDVMRGVLSRRDNKNNALDFNFVSVKK